MGRSLFFYLFFILIFFSLSCDDNSSGGETNNDDIELYLEGFQTISDSAVTEFTSETAEAVEEINSTKKIKFNSKAGSCGEGKTRDISIENGEDGLHWVVTFCEHETKNSFATLDGSFHIKRGGLTEKTFSLWTSTDGITYVASDTFKNLYMTILTSVFSQFNTSNCDESDEPNKCKAIKVFLEYMDGKDYSDIYGTIKISSSNPATAKIITHPELGQALSIYGTFNIENCTKDDKGDIECYNSYFEIDPGEELVWKLPVQTNCNCPLDGKVIISSDQYMEDKSITFYNDCETLDSCCGKSTVEFNNYETNCKSFVDQWLSLTDQKNDNKICNEEQIYSEDKYYTKSDSCINGTVINNCTACGSDRCYTCIVGQCGTQNNTVECSSEDDCCTRSGYCVTESGSSPIEDETGCCSSCIPISTCTTDNDCCNSFPHCYETPNSGIKTCVECTDNTHCDTGKECILNSCQEVSSECTEDDTSNCGDDLCYSCLGGKCCKINICSTDDDCCDKLPKCYKQNGDNGVCSECKEDGDCEAGKICAAGFCRESGSLNKEQEECLREYINQKSTEELLLELCPKKSSKN